MLGVSKGAWTRVERGKALGFLVVTTRGVNAPRDPYAQATPSMARLDRLPARERHPELTLGGAQILRDVDLRYTRLESAAQARVRRDPLFSLEKGASERRQDACGGATKRQRAPQRANRLSGP